MVFQDFDEIQGRVNAQRKRKFRKRLLIAFVSVLLVTAAAIGGVFAYIKLKEENQADAKSSSRHGSQSENQKAAPDSKSPPQTQPPIEKIIKTLCDSTRYKDNCEKTLKSAAKPGTTSSNPENLLKSAISATNSDLEKAFDKVTSLKIEKQEDIDAMEQCKNVLNNAKDELKASVNKVSNTDVKDFGKLSPELNSKLSAVMSYKETCLDAFEDGELKSDLAKTVNSSRILTSNSLAMVKSFGTYLSGVPNVPTRHLLASSSMSAVVSGRDEIPSWVDRRVLKGVNVEELKPNVTVAKDGSGNFSTINEALNAMPENYKGRYLIYVKQGVYDETVTVDKKKANLTLVGDGSQKTVVTGSKSHPKKIRTFKTATFVAQGEGFMAQSIGFRNTAGVEGQQAVAIRVQSDRAIFVNCRFEGHQETLNAYAHRQYYRSCVITGTVDFIFGDAAAIFQNCDIFVRKGVSGQRNTVTAQGRTDPFQTTGFVLQNCTITGDDELNSVKKDFKSYLGRPWKSYSRAVVMESTIDDVIDPAGWLRWQDTDFGIKTVYYAEFKNDGASGKTGTRVKWPGFKVIGKEEALKYTVGPFLQGAWINATGSPVKYGLYDA